MAFTNRFQALSKLMDEQTQQGNTARPSQLRTHPGTKSKSRLKPKPEAKPPQVPPDATAFPSLGSAPKETKPAWPIVRDDPVSIAARKKAQDALAAQNEGKLSRVAADERMRMMRNKAINERFSKSVGNIVDALAEDGSDDDWDL